MAFWLDDQFCDEVCGIQCHCRVGSWGCRGTVLPWAKYLGRQEVPYVTKDVGMKELKVKRNNKIKKGKY